MTWGIGLGPMSTNATDFENPAETGDHPPP